MPTEPMQNGQVVLTAVKALGPVTAQNLIAHIAWACGVHPSDINECVMKTLNGGVEYGFIQKRNREYLCEPILEWELGRAPPTQHATTTTNIVPITPSQPTNIEAGSGVSAEESVSSVSDSENWAYSCESGRRDFSGNGSKSQCQPLHPPRNK